MVVGLLLLVNFESKLLKDYFVLIGSAMFMKLHLKLKVNSEFNFSFG